jgi:hypothetical protein
MTIGCSLLLSLQRSVESGVGQPLALAFALLGHDQYQINVVSPTVLSWATIITRCRKAG